MMVLAAASVPCPHSATSVVGVNHLRSKEDEEENDSAFIDGATNAVSERFISRAICRTEVSPRDARPEGHRHTPAGLPAKETGIRVLILQADA